MSNEKSAPQAVLEHLVRLDPFVDTIKEVDGEWAIATGPLTKLSDMMAITSIFNTNTKHYSIQDTLAELHYIFSNEKILNETYNTIKDFRVELNGFTLTIQIEVGGYDSGFNGTTEATYALLDVTHTCKVEMSGLAVRMFVINSLNSLHPSVRLNTNHIRRDFIIERMGQLFSIYDLDHHDTCLPETATQLRRNTVEYMDAKSKFQKLCMTADWAGGTADEALRSYVYLLKGLVDERNKLFTKAESEKLK